MKKRLRKKKRIGEFAEFGRQLVAFRNTKMNPNEFHDAFISEAIENNGLLCGGGLSEDKISVIVQLGKMSENPESKFVKVTAWLDERSDIEKWIVGPLFDLNYDDYEDIDK